MKEFMDQFSIEKAVEKIKLIRNVSHVFQYMQEPYYDAIRFSQLQQVQEHSSQLDCLMVGAVSITGPTSPSGEPAACQCCNVVRLPVPDSQCSGMCAVSPDSQWSGMCAACPDSQWFGMCVSVWLLWVCCTWLQGVHEQLGRFVGTWQPRWRYVDGPVW
jgi:hypothetical protein